MLIKRVLLFSMTLIAQACGDTGNNKKVDDISSSNTSGTSPIIKNKHKDYFRIRNLESLITLPEGAYQLNRYDRYYVIDENKFDAIYIRASEKNGTINIVLTKDELPFMLDGGCQLIRVSGSFSNLENIDVLCNGHA